MGRGRSLSRSPSIGTGYRQEEDARGYSEYQYSQHRRRDSRSRSPSIGTGYRQHGGEPAKVDFDDGGSSLLRDQAVVQFTSETDKTKEKKEKKDKKKDKKEKKREKKEKKKRKKEKKREKANKRGGSNPSDSEEEPSKRERLDSASEDESNPVKRVRLDSESEHNNEQKQNDETAEALDSTSSGTKKEQTSEPVRQKLSKKDFFAQIVAAESTKEQIGTFHAVGDKSGSYVNSVGIVTNFDSAGKKENKGDWECPKCGVMNMRLAFQCTKCRALKRMTEYR